MTQLTLIFQIHLVNRLAVEGAKGTNVGQTGHIPSCAEEGKFREEGANFIIIYFQHNTIMLFFYFMHNFILSVGKLLIIHIDGGKGFNFTSSDIEREKLILYGIVLAVNVALLVVDTETAGYNNNQLRYLCLD
ncbi:hypothetical protein ACJX0J_014152 [Zea mays]